MTRSTRDLVFGLLGGVVLFVGLVVMTRSLDGGESDDRDSPTSTIAAGDLASVGADAVVAVTETNPVTSVALTTTTTTGPTTTLTTVIASLTVGPLRSTEPELWEAAAACSGLPQEAEVSIPIAGPNPVVGVVLGWGVDGPEYELEWVEPTESTPGVYSYSLGPFGEDTLDSGVGELIILAVEAVDAADEGAYIESDPLIILHDCEAGA